ncbi:MAG: hypothetical protein HY210_04455 [Candidatus Omnitrophica bacterium]|nr:hypothetical protein [Candidatus Omnitrophota bacterium]
MVNEFLLIHAAYIRDIRREANDLETRPLFVGGLSDDFVKGRDGSLLNNRMLEDKNALRKVIVLQNSKGVTDIIFGVGGGGVQRQDIFFVYTVGKQYLFEYLGLGFFGIHRDTRAFTRPVSAGNKYFRYDA